LDNFWGKIIFIGSNKILGQTNYKICPKAPAVSAD
jgi:hypothetical protein